MSTRSVALENVIEILEKNQPLHIILSKSLEAFSEETDRAFLSRLTRGVVERKMTLDGIISQKSSVKLNRMKPVIRNILRCGIYQILFMDSVTDFAACDESVKLAGKRGFRQLGGFVNGILRNVCRDEELRKSFSCGDEAAAGSEKKKLPSENETQKPADSAEGLSERYSMPLWIAKEWTERFGFEKTEKAFRYFLESNGISIRCNLSKTEPDQLERRLMEKGIKVVKSELCPKCLRLTDCGSPEQIEEFRRGLFTIQDMSSVFAGLIDLKKLGKKPEDCRVLDLCAAPGGKSLHMADYGFSVVSCDLTGKKTDMIKDNVKRCGFDNITVCQNDALVFREEFESSFEIVLCDLPCSGLGIIGRKPDIKYNMQKDKQLELVKLQKEMLAVAVRYLKKDGLLIYSTCTVNTDENEKMTDYITGQLGLSREMVHSLPAPLAAEYEKNCYIQILPGEYGTDGFFISGFRK